MWRKSMSHAVLGLREEPLYKGTRGAWDLGHEPSPLHTQRLKSQHHENSSSTSSTTALSVSGSHTLRELHPPLPPYFLCHVFGPWRSCFSGLFGSITPSPHLRFAASLSVCMVCNNLSPMLHTGGTTVRSRRKLFNRLRRFPRSLHLC